MRLPIGSVPPRRREEPHPALADEGLRHGVGLGHFRPRRGFECREPLADLLGFLVRHVLRDRVHARRVFPGAALEVGHLLDQVGGGEAGQAGRLRMAFSGHQMAGAAGQRRPVALLHQRRRRRVLIGEPVGRIHQVVDLRRGVRLAAAGHALGALLRRQRLVDRRERPGGLPAGRGRCRLLRGRRPDTHPGDHDRADDSFHNRPPSQKVQTGKFKVEK